MELTLGFSPCPNDTFIFDALVHQKIDTEGLSFKTCLGDVEELNQKAFRGELDITKLSYHAYAYLVKNYTLLNAGSALGNNCGPLLVKRAGEETSSVDQLSISIPGQYTTANFLLSLAYPNAQNKEERLFSDIERAILSKEVDAGLLIHENRFTYHERGLEKIIDLGQWWEEKTQVPIPLGGIVVRRNFDQALQQKIDRVLRRSVEYAFTHPDSSIPFVRAHAQEMDEAVMKQHIELYVNKYSIDLGVKGKEAIEFLFQKAVELNLIQPYEENIFVAQ